MRAGWQWKPLGDVCKTGSGGTPLKDKKEYYEGGTIPWLMSGEVSQGEVLEATKFITQQGLENSAAKIFPKDTVLVAMYGATAGQVGILRFEATTNQAVCGIYPSSQFLPEFLFYCLLSKKEELVAQATGNAQPNISQIKIKNTEVPILPLSEQQRIVGILDDAFDGIATAKANAEQNLQNARALFESHLQSVFTQRGEGWVEKPLSAVCDLQNGYAFKSGDYIESSNTLNIRMSSIRPGGSFDSEHNQRFLPDAYAIEYASFLLKEGDLIIAMTDMAGDPKILGVPTLVSNLNGRNFLMNQRVGKLYKFSHDVRVPYLRYFLSSPLIKQYYKSKGAGGLQINISKGDILSAQIPIPGIAVQDRIVNQLNELDEETQRLESLYQRKLAALAELKKSLLHQAFSGAL